MSLAFPDDDDVQPGASSFTRDVDWHDNRVNERETGLGCRASPQLECVRFTLDIILGSNCDCVAYSLIDLFLNGQSLGVFLTALTLLHTGRLGHGLSDRVCS